jgi:mono/diheme cytochrome c family protein
MKLKGQKSFLLRGLSALMQIKAPPRKSYDPLEPMRCLAAVMLGAWLSIIASSSHAQTELVKKGAEILRTNCSSCHAIGRDDVSAHAQAPAFRTLSSRYPIEYLSEALAEGLSSGHPDMPDFIFKPEEVKAILAYLQSIQQSHKPGAK